MDKSLNDNLVVNNVGELSASSTDDSSDDSDDGSSFASSHSDSYSNDYNSNKLSNKSKNNQKRFETFHRNNSNLDDYDPEEAIVSHDNHHSNTKPKSVSKREDFRQILETFPDALRRSSRSRKEPERFQIEPYYSDRSDSPKLNRKHRDDWNNHNEIDEDFDAINEDLSDNVRTDSDTDDEYKTTSVRNSSRINKQSKSFKNRHDTDSDDLIEVNSYDDSKTNQEIDDKEEQGEVIERILEHRFGRIDATEDIDYYEGQEELNYQLRQLHLNVERIIAHQPPKTGIGPTCHPDYLCKWEGLPYSECTWEDGGLITRLFKSKVSEYYLRAKSQSVPAKNCRVLKQRPKFVPMKTQPSFIGDKENLKLRDYQLDGLNWLAQSWCRDNSVILADEMGLGKTIQTISFLNYLYHQHSLYGPFLLVVPLSTLAAWQKEFEIWAPSMNVVVYIGDATSRHMIREYEWSFTANQRIKFNVLITTYEILLREKAFLSLVSWAVLGVDEAHRLKNDESCLYKCLFSFDTNHRLLITGTPLQNSLRELWALLHFIMPNRFESWESFEYEHQDSYQKGFSKLHSQLQQFLLRRVKKDVEKSLPAKVEQILRVDMTSIQKQFYRWILTKNYKALSKGIKGSVTSFTNIVMELKKCCNHASLIRPLDEYPNLDSLQRLIRGSGKLLLLDKLLCRLKETGHRVLIFSQMVRMLDLLGEYLSLRRFSYQRLDGSIRGEFRKQALEHFNAEGSQDFCFLLSTRAGGLGINLATADTVIIFDSDWNPQNDLQAQARAHRIGQKNQVNIYRLVTKGSVEEDIIERAKRKMVLDHLVIQRMDTSGHTIIRSSNSNSESTKENKPSNNTSPFNKEELSAILKFGAEDLFKETENGDEEPQCDIDEILKRAETRDDDGPQTLGDELLNSFKVASFNFNEEEDVQAVSINQDGQKDWSEIIPESERLKFEQDEKQKEQMEMMMLPRCRNKSKPNNSKSDDSGDEYDPNAKNDSPCSEDSDVDRPKRRGKSKSSYKESIRGFSEQEIRRFIKSYRKFPTPLNRLESIAIDAELQEKPLPDLHQLALRLEQNCKIAMEESERFQTNENSSTRKNNRGPSFKMAGVTVFARGIIANQKELKPLAIMLPANQEERKKWILTDIKIKSVNWDCNWSIENDSRLLAGVYEYGFGNWEAIKMDPNCHLSDKAKKFQSIHLILPDGDSKPQAKQLQSRVEYLLKIMYRHLIAQRKIESSSPTEAFLKNSSSSKKSKISNEKAQEYGRDGKKIWSEKELKNAEKVSKKKAHKKIDSLSSTLNSNVKSEDKKIFDKEEMLKHRKKHREQSQKFNEKEKDSIISNDQSLNCPISSDELSQETFIECKEKMRAVKKALKAFNNIDDQKLSKSKRKELLYEHIAIIGQHIDSCLEEHRQNPIKMKEWRNNLWTFVSKFTVFPAKKLYRFYRHVKLKNKSLREEESTSEKISSNRHSDSHHRSSEKHHRQNRTMDSTTNSENNIDGSNHEQNFQTEFIS
ncbi:chromodomain-helicase-DNA-binding protein 1-like protein [Sarcoptes scabiei]|uniref:Chromodomain-helicase-DNA-binding protein 1 n=1 Tax=Sarcoptes scabiei TaxID=52283 RepID=A0A132A5Q5_SARSC|nr:chromodomain-helicase-DNA-binding protein 1-like protein [Sarcoptes scabiei]